MSYAIMTLQRLQTMKRVIFLSKSRRLNHTLPVLIGSNTTSRTMSSSSSNDDVTREVLLDEASFLTRSLYRMCLRSVNVIRHGNEFDEKEFQRRDEEFSNPKPGIISMTPPPHREDELLSRAEYYRSYAREYFIQESDCLDNDPLHEKDIKRYLYYLRKGNKDRKWLLSDMMFPDPYKDAMDQEKIEQFESMSRKYFGIEEEQEEEETDNDSVSNSDAFFDADDENPEWFQKKFPHLK